MTREEAKELLPIIQAFAEGKTIQYHSGIGWVNIKSVISITESPTQYRIKPEPKYRPFKAQEECWEEMLKHQPFGWLKHKTRREYAHIDGLIRVGQADFVRCLTIERYDHEFYNMCKNYTFLDGVPFGVKEE